jgi:hypothetical protein
MDGEKDAWELAKERRLCMLHPLLVYQLMPGFEVILLTSIPITVFAGYLFY